MQTQTYFEKVVDFNTQFGVKLHTTPQPNIFDIEPANVNFCMRLINEEHKELTEAVANKDFVEVADAIADSIYVLLGMSARLGINMDQVFSMVHENNMSKLCKTEEEAELSVQHYKLNPNLGFDTPNYRRAEDGVHWVVFNESTKKILKSVNYQPVDLSFLLNMEKNTAPKKEIELIKFIVSNINVIHNKIAPAYFTDKVKECLVEFYYNNDVLEHHYSLRELLNGIQNIIINSTTVTPSGLAQSGLSPDEVTPSGLAQSGLSPDGVTNHDTLRLKSINDRQQVMNYLINFGFNK